MHRAAFIGVLLLASCRADAQRTGAEATDEPTGFDSSLVEGNVIDTSARAVACRIDGPPRALPADVRESSGLARGRFDSSLFWTHNDAGNPPQLFALDTEGNLVGRVTLVDATTTDWEDIEAGPCSAGDCLYVADIGDNGGERESISIYLVPEPREPFEAVTPVATLRARFPEGRWDAEALFTLPNGSIYIVTKGREGPIVLYALSADGNPVSGTEAGVLRRIRQLLPPPVDELDRVTAATATPDGRWVAIRTYRALLLYPAASLVAGDPLEPAVVDLSGLGHPQGESVAMSDDGSVWLTSEAEGGGAPALWSRLQCDLPGG